MSLTSPDQARRDLERYFHVVLPDALGNPALGFRDGTWFRLGAGQRPEPLMARSAILEQPDQAGSIVQIICWWMREHYNHPRALDLATELAITVAELARGGSRKHPPVPAPLELTAGPSQPYGADPLGLGSQPLQLPAATGSYRAEPTPAYAAAQSEAYPMGQVGAMEPAPAQGYPDSWSGAWPAGGQQAAPVPTAIPGPALPAPTPQSPAQFADPRTGGNRVPGREHTGPWPVEQPPVPAPAYPPQTGGYQLPAERLAPDVAATPPYSGTGGYLAPRPEAGAGYGPPPAATAQSETYRW